MAFTTLGDAAGVEADVRRRLASGGADWRGSAFRALLLFGLLLTLLIIVVLLVDVITDGSTVLTERLGDFLNGTLRSRSSDALLGVHQALRGSIWIGDIRGGPGLPHRDRGGDLPRGVRNRTRLTRFIQLNIRNLAGVPSVVYGLLGLAIFVKLLGGSSSSGGLTGGRSLVSAGITLAVLVLPVVIITSAEAIRAVPDSLREGGYGVGATKWEVIRSHVLPYAAPGILTGTLLSMSRAIGEAAPLILVGAVTGRLGGDTGIFDVGGLRDRFTAMPIVITDWVKKANGGSDDGGAGLDFASHAAAAIVVLMVLVLVLNSAAIVMRNRFEKKRG